MDNYWDEWAAGVFEPVVKTRMVVKTKMVGHYGPPETCPCDNCTFMRESEECQQNTQTQESSGTTG